DVNWYRYVNNSPLNYTDPEGLFHCEIDCAFADLSNKCDAVIKSLVYASLIGPEGKGDGNTIDDDIAHCLSQCELAKSFGKELAKKLGDLKEKLDQCKKDFDQSDSDEDQKSNEAGRRCADDPRGCECCCAEAV
ncbi:MAG: hypothetical protein NZM04_07905, partial [Methylacidiphilales bacterium]|nr:hypothetical protein [Candidatus Methylacidiphilales bacterium]